MNLDITRLFIRYPQRFVSIYFFFFLILFSASCNPKHHYDIYLCFDKEILLSPKQTVLATNIIPQYEKCRASGKDAKVKIENGIEPDYWLRYYDTDNNNAIYVIEIILGSGRMITKCRKAGDVIICEDANINKQILSIIHEINKNEDKNPFVNIK